MTVDLAPLLRRIVFICETMLRAGLDLEGMTLCTMGGCDRVVVCLLRP